MDRFIGDFVGDYTVLEDTLKSNMDRFIETLFLAVFDVFIFFKIQYG